MRKSARESMYHVLLVVPCHLRFFHVKFVSCRFPKREELLLTFTIVADPGFTFLILVPLFAILSPKLSSDVLMVSIVTEWSNILLQWLFMEERPYWWAKERELLRKYPVPVLRQTPFTCETSPGSPSGHMMGSAAVLYTIMHFINDSISRHTSFSEANARRVKLLLWMLFIAIEVLIAASRIYFATHFPHQCFLGVLIGIFIARLFLCDPTFSAWWQHTRTRQLLIAPAIMIFFSYGAHLLQKSLDIDPHWSIKMAFKWCASPEWVHVDTTPFFSLVRVSGVAYGLALIGPVVTKQTRSRKSLNYLVTGVLISGFTIIIYHAQAWVPTDERITFYLGVFTLYAFQPYIYFVIVPFLASHCVHFFDPSLN
ncbi:glucose-6-phosphatase catalytic subunit 1 isoform X1 [Athalia rosae]|uniref:glucose-6-phosphatase catalytic subunit 1 isoform X1 n=2 Tax=Athalia rosae TaxID=37344 RepID=UPI002033C910|nr:glucose-6-phosphatase catalytic subunit 1 isoform X1 [Athalia rosae]